MQDTEEAGWYKGLRMNTSASRFSVFQSPYTTPPQCWVLASVTP